MPNANATLSEKIVDAYLTGRDDAVIDAIESTFADSQARLNIDSFAELATVTDAETGDVVVWREKGFRYQCVTSGEHFDYTGSGGLKWKVLPGPNGRDIEAFGAVGDDSTINTTAVKAWLAAAGILYVPEGTFLFDPSASDFGYYGSTFIHGEGEDSVLKLKFASNPVTATIQQLLRPANYDNVDYFYIHNVCLDGNRDGNTWTGVSGDGNAHGLTIWGGQNVYIGDIWVKNCWTDGVYIAYTHSSKGTRRNAANVNFGRVFVDTCGRQGMSVISCSGLRVGELLADTINRTAPQAALDLEPNGSPDKIENVWVGRVTGIDVGAGVLLTGTTSLTNIEIGSIDCNVTTTTGFQIAGSQNVRIGSVRIYMETGAYQAVLIKDYDNVEIQSLHTELDASVSSGTTDAILVDNATALFGNDDLRIHEYYVKSARGSGIRVEANCDAWIGRGHVISCNAGGAGGVGHFFEGEVTAEYIKTEGSAHAYALRTGAGVVNVKDGHLTTGATAGVLKSTGAVTLGTTKLDGVGIDYHEVRTTIASGATYTFPANLVTNKCYWRIIPDNRPTYGGDFGSFSTDAPTSFGVGSKVDLQAATGGSTADDKIRVFPASGSTMSFLNNTLSSLSLRIMCWTR